MSERNNVLILLALFAIMGLAATAMQIFQGSDVNEITVSLNNTGNLDTPVQSITYISQSRADIKSMLDAHIVSGYSDPRYLFNGNYYSSKSSTPIDSTATTLTDYPMNIVLNHSDFPGISSDFSDMRFATADDTNIPYHEDTVVSDTSADIWMKIPSTSTTASTYISGYYGNSGVSSASNSGDVYDLYDHFEGTSLNSATFETFGVGTVTVAGSVLTLSPLFTTTYASGLYSKNPVLSKDNMLEFRTQAVESSNNARVGFAKIHDGTTSINTDDSYTVYHFQTGLIAIIYKDGTEVSRTTSAKDENYHTWKFHNDGTNVNIWRDEVSQGSIATGTEFDTGMYFSAVGYASAANDGNINIDYVINRKYILPEPTWSSNTWTVESTTSQITPSTITLNSIINTTGIYGSYPIIPANTEQDFILNGTQNFNYTIDFTPTDLTVTTSSSVLYADRAHVFNAVVKDHNTGVVMSTQPDKVKYRLIGSGNTSVSAKEFVGTSLTLPALQKGTYTLFTSVGWDNIPSWSNEISQSVVLTDAATPAQAAALSVVEALTDTTTDTTSNETTKDVLVGVPGRIADGWKSMIDDIITFIKNIIHNVSAVFS